MSSKGIRSLILRSRSGCLAVVSSLIPPPLLFLSLALPNKAFPLTWSRSTFAKTWILSVRHSMSRRMVKRCNSVTARSYITWRDFVSSSSSSTLLLGVMFDCVGSDDVEQSPAKVRRAYYFYQTHHFEKFSGRDSRHCVCGKSNGRATTKRCEATT